MEKEKVLVLIKPDGVRRKLIGKIISRYEDKNLNIIALKMVTPSKEIVEKHYEQHMNKPFFRELVDYLTGGKICVLVIEGNNAIESIRKINGATDPLKAEVGTIREVYAESKTKNMVHASDSKESAEREIEIWFPEKTVKI